MYLYDLSSCFSLGMNQPAGDMNNHPFYFPMMPQLVPVYMGNQPEMQNQNDSKQR